MRRVLNEMRDAARFFLLPFLLALLPHRACTKIVAALAARPWFFEAEAQASLAAARRFISIPDETRWLRDYRLIRFTDEVDLFLSLLRGDKWLARHVSVKGSWPADKSFVTTTFHWGNGIWALRSLRNAGAKMTAVLGKMERSAFPGQTVRYWYVLLRQWETERIIAGGARSPGSAVRQLISALRAGFAIGLVFDVPVHAGTKSLSGKLFGRNAHFARGLARIAVVEAKPVLLFISCVDPQSGKREIWIDPPQRFTNETELGKHLAQRLQYAVELRSTAWHRWYEVDAFIDATAQTESNSGNRIAA
jgi:phosphatidylinositol dimannoside acyltransferase